MIVTEQAMYGATLGGHGILTCSGERSIAEEIATRLDLPDTAPPGVAWSPYLSGFPYKNLYILARTMLDAEAERGGIVFAHALLAPVDGFVSSNNLRPFVERLSDRPQRPESLESLRISVDDEGPVTSSREFVSAVNTLTTRKPGPAVRLGIEGFDELVIALWAQIWPSLRRQFAFRLSFTPSDLTEVPSPSLICTPRNLAARWTGYKIIPLSEEFALPTAAASLLVGDTFGHRVLDFATGLGLEMKSFTDLGLVEQAYSVYGQGDNLEAMISVVRLVERLSPTTEAGALQKQKLLNDLLRLIPTASSAQVLLLRNFSITKIAGIEHLWKQLSLWMQKNSYAEANDASLVTVIENALSETAGVDEWRQAVLIGLHAASLSLSSAFPNAFWRLTSLNVVLAMHLFELLGADSTLENRLNETVPKHLPKDASEQLMKSSLAKGWLQLHGSVAAAGYSLEEAVRRQLDVDIAPSLLDGLRAATRLASTSDVIECAVRWNDPRLIVLAAEAVVRQPQALEPCDFGNVRIQRIWSEAMGHSPSLYKAMAQPSSAVGAVFDALVDGKEVDQSLLAALAKTPLADLLEYPRRSLVWALLKGEVATRYLRATARSWVQRFVHGDTSRILDPELQSALLTDDKFYADLNALCPASYVSGLSLILALPGFDQGRFLAWLSFMLSRVPTVAEDAATRMGRLIALRQWTRAAERLVNAFASGRTDLRPALLACVDLLSWWTRLRYSLAHTSGDTKWQILQEIVVQLYPWGPEERELWERSGGKNKDLQHHGDGQTRWYDTLNKVRNGGGTSVAALIHVMRQDFPSNEQLRYLSEDAEFRGRRR